MNEKQKNEIVRQLVEGSHVFWKCLNCQSRFAMEVEGAIRNHDIPLTCGNCESGGRCEFDLEQAKQHYSDLIDHAVLWGSEETDFHRSVRKTMGKDFPIHGDVAAMRCWYCVNRQDP